MLALKEWHVVCEAIGRGDQVLTIRKGGIREKEFAVEGAQFWLFPTWEHENAGELKRAWHGELSRSQRERRTDGSIPVRARCTVVEAWELTDVDAVAALDRFHPWTEDYAVQRLRWRPTKPLVALLVRAEALVDPFVLPPSEAYGGCKSWVELESNPPADALLPSLTDDAFELFAEAVRDALDGVGTPRPVSSLDGRLALVTGGSRGIGRTIAIDLARRGADVAISYLRNEDAAAEAVSAIEAEGRRGVALRGRVDSTERAHALVDGAAEALGGLDLLVSNAASGVIRPALEATERHWDWTLDTNARALLLLAQRAAPLMQERGGGAIVAMSSLGSMRVLKNYALVGVSKAALEACVRYLGVELAPLGIRVNTVSGGVVETGALEHFPNREELLASGRDHTPAGRLLVPQDLANAVAFLASPEASMIVGHTLVVDGGYSLPA